MRGTSACLCPYYIRSQTPYDKPDYLLSFCSVKSSQKHFFLVIVKLGSIRKTVLTSNVTRKNETLNRIKIVTLIINFF